MPIRSRTPTRKALGSVPYELPQNCRRSWCSLGKAMSTSQSSHPDDRPDLPAQTARKLRFGVFELDLEGRELRKSGVHIRLQQKPFQILDLLLRQPGTLVTRKQLARHLWPNLYVNFDRSLNTAVNVLRQVLGDSSRSCRYIETRPGLGYRFVAHVEEISEKASLSLSAGQIRPTERTHKTSIDAYQDYLRGRYFYSRMREEDLRKSIAHFESALRQEPRHALAYAGLSDVYRMFALLGVLVPHEAQRRAMQLAMASLQIDEQLPEGHVSLAGIKSLFEWDWAGAGSEYLKAIELNPNCAGAHHSYAAHLSAMARAEEAIKEIRTAYELDPLSLLINVEIARTLYWAGDFKGAVEQCWKTLVLEQECAPAQYTLGLAYEQLAMVEEAVVEFENARVCSGSHPSTIAALGHAHAIAGNERSALEMLEELERVSKSRYVSFYWHAIVYAGLGTDNLAIQSLEKAYEKRDVWLMWLRVEPRFDRLRPEPRFNDLLRKLRLRSALTQAAG